LGGKSTEPIDLKQLLHLSFIVFYRSLTSEKSKLFINKIVPQ